MTATARDARLAEVAVTTIDRNPENPRLLFRQAEMEKLLESIRMYGIQVPISVYREGGRHVLIDGERRWLCARKLNRRTIPALIQPKPSRLQNLLLMFNIHALREQWDYLTIAMKIAPIADLIEQETGERPKEKELAQRTGLTRAMIRRCKLLLELPERYQAQILDELAKPKPEQRLTEDFFIEMEKALKTVQNRMPMLLPDQKKDQVRETLIQKYKDNVIPNRVHFRKIGKIARAENVDAEVGAAERVLKRLFTDPKYSIDAAFAESVSEAYLERDIGTRVTGLLEMLEDVRPTDLDHNLTELLERLLVRLRGLLGR